MSKGNMLLGHARGKVGSLVFSRANGKQIVRAKADVIKNPQTQAQMIQRILLNTISQAYSKMSAICDHSFQGIPKGQDSMSYFMRVNLKNLRQKVADAIASGETFEEIFSFTPVGSNVFVPNNYEIAKGKLPSITPLQGDADQYMAMALPANTYQSIIDTYGLQRGDQLTFVGVQGADADHLSFQFARVILDPRDEADQPMDLDSAFIGADGINYPNPRNEGVFSVLQFSSDHINFAFAGAYDVTMSSAIIVSRKGEGDEWERSNAVLVAKEASAELVYSLQWALDQLDNGGFNTESTRYLNNAGKNRTANAEVVLTPSVQSLSVGSNAVTRGGTATVAASGSANFSGVVANPRAGLKVGVYNAFSSEFEVSGTVDATTGAFSGTIAGVDAGDYQIVLGEVSGSTVTVIDEYATLRVTS